MGSDRCHIARGLRHVHDTLYHDAIHVKGNTFLLLISEVFGGVNGRSIRFLTRLAHSARSASDSVHFDRAGRPVSFFSHYACALSSAAAVGHGRVIQKHAEGLRSQAARLRAGPAGEAWRGSCVALLSWFCIGRGLYTRKVAKS